MGIKTVAMALLFVSLVTEPCFAVGAGPELTVELQPWLADLAAHGRYATPSLQAGYRDIDIKKDLGFQNRVLSSISLSWKKSPTREVRIEGFDTTYYGQGILKDRFLINELFSREFTAQATEKMHLEYQRVVWVNYESSDRSKKFRKAFIYDIKRAVMRGNLQASVTANNLQRPIIFTGSTSWRGVLPTIGGYIGFQPDANNRIGLEASGISTGPRGFYYLDWKSEFEHLLGQDKSTSLVLGYRALDFKNMRSTDGSKLSAVKIAGYYWGLKVKM